MRYIITENRQMICVSSTYEQSARELRLGSRQNCVVRGDLVLKTPVFLIGPETIKEIARIARESLEKDMTREQIAEAQRLSSEWKAKPK